MSEVVKRCAACGKENPVSSMKTCMHSQMHYYVCDSKCMTDFYNPPKKPTERELRIKAETERDAALAELAALKGGREAVPMDSIKRLLSNWDDLKDGDSLHVDAVRKWVSAPPAQASAWVPEGLTAITRSMGRAIVRFKTTEQLNAFYRSMKSAIAAPTPGASD